MIKVKDVVLDTAGNGVHNATVTITTYPGGAPAVLYSDNGTTAYATNSVLTNTKGEYEFYIPNGRYSRTVSKAGATSVTDLDSIYANDTAGLTIANGKTLTVNNSMTLAGTDGTTVTFPSASGTLATLGGAQTFYGLQTFTDGLTSNGATTIGSSLSVTGPTSVTTLAASSNATVGGTLAVTGNTNLSTVATSGAATLNSATVTGAATVGTTLGVSGNSTVGGTLGVTGATTLSTLSTSGAATLNSAAVTNNATVGGTLGVTGATTLAGTTASTLTTTGAATLNSASVTGNATVGGTLGVTGATTLAGTTASTLATTGLATLDSATVTNNATVGGTLGVTGTTTLATLNASGNVNLATNGGGSTIVSAGNSTSENAIAFQGRGSGSAPRVYAYGFDTNITLQISSKGVNPIEFYTRNFGSQSKHLTISDTFQAVNYYNITGNASPLAPILSVLGSDTNIDARITPKGTGLLSTTGLKIDEGTNKKMGITAAMTAGSITVSTTAVTANSRIFLTAQNTGGTPGALRVSARTAGTSFTITSTSGTDTSTVAWMIVEPA